MISKSIGRIRKFGEQRLYVIPNYIPNKPYNITIGYSYCKLGLISDSVDFAYIRTTL